MPLCAAFLDFDGLILETETSGFLSLQEVFRSRGADYDLADYLQIVGTHYSIDEAVELLDRRTGRAWDRAAIVAERSAHEERLNAALAPLPGVRELIATVRTRGWKLGVVSSSSHDWVDRHLRHHGLLACFDTIVCRGDALRVKPAPDLYLEALRRFGVAPAEAVAFEDSHNGSLAAKWAGLHCVAVPGAITRTQDFTHCDLVVDTLTGFNLDILEQQLPHAR